MPTPSMYSDAQALWVKLWSSGQAMMSSILLGFQQPVCPLIWHMISHWYLMLWLAYFTARAGLWMFQDYGDFSGATTPVAFLSSSQTSTFLFLFQQLTTTTFGPVTLDALLPSTHATCNVPLFHKPFPLKWGDQVVHGFNCQALEGIRLVFPMCKSVGWKNFIACTERVYMAFWILATTSVVKLCQVFLWNNTQGLSV
jgi:hypothetical protein